ncbi:retrovirus-related pol polyprotein from transposon TNT 1-94 [Tanacetum coccineum]
MAPKAFSFDCGTINQLASKDLVDGLSKFKYNKDHLCSACEQGKSKKALFPPKLVPSTESKLELIHIDLCGPIRIASINGKKYILVIVDDYSRYTWVYFLRTKDEAPDMIINFINQVQHNLKAKILKIRTNNETEFRNENLRSFYAKLGINQSIIHTRYNKTPYEMIRGRGPNIQYFHVFGSLCYPTNDRDDHGKMKPKADIGYYVPSTSEVTNNSAANTLDVEDTPSPSSIIVKDSDASQIVTSLKEPFTQELSIPVLETHPDEQLQEDVAKLNRNTIMHSFKNPEIEEAESSLNYQDPSNMHEFHQQHRYTDK